MNIFDNNQLIKLLVFHFPRVYLVLLKENINKSSFVAEKKYYFIYVKLKNNSFYIEPQKKINRWELMTLEELKYKYPNNKIQISKQEMTAHDVFKVICKNNFQSLYKHYNAALARHIAHRERHPEKYSKKSMAHKKAKRYLKKIKVNKERK